jgi:hypothetical protein
MEIKTKKMAVFPQFIAKENSANTAAKKISGPSSSHPSLGL